MNTVREASALADCKNTIRDVIMRTADGSISFKKYDPPNLHDGFRSTITKVFPVDVENAERTLYEALAELEREGYQVDPKVIRPRTDDQEIHPAEIEVTVRQP